MAANEFLSHFGTVELDNDVDLKKFSQLEEDLRQVRQQTFLPIAEDLSFRMRKLGNYRALRVYFPAFNATVFDLDGPDAFIHERGHHFDYSWRADGKLLSEQVDFLLVYDSYTAAVNRNVKELPAAYPFLIQWVGNNKYNAAYYLRNTEVFARSYELYPTRIW